MRPCCSQQGFFIADLVVFQWVRRPSYFYFVYFLLLVSVRGAIFVETNHTIMTQIIINYTDPITGDEASNIFDVFEDAYDFVCNPVNWPVTSVEVRSDDSAECGFYTAEEFVDYFNA